MASETRGHRPLFSGRIAKHRLSGAVYASARRVRSYRRGEDTPEIAATYQKARLIRPVVGLRNILDIAPKTPAELGIDEELLDEAMDIVQPFEKMLPIKVLDELLYVPEKNSLWRGLQFSGIVQGKMSIDFSNFCIAGTCKNCRALIQEADKDGREPMLLCQTQAKAGTHIRKLPSGFRLKKKQY